MQKVSIHTAAQTLKDQLAQQSVVPNGLFQFAKNYAVTRGLLNEALVLQLRYFSAKADEQAGLDAVFSDLIERIVEDHEQHADSERALQEQQKKEQAKIMAETLQPEKETVVELKELTKKYRRGHFRLDPLNLRFHLGEITGIVGANANGKSTLTRMIVGELLKSGGSIYFPYFNKGRRHELPWGEVKHRIAYIPQEIPHWEGGLKETLYYEAASHGIKGKEIF
jgi:ATPase subunit of ABC transporter with duplicated ATPase domains